MTFSTKHNIESLKHNSNQIEIHFGFVLLKQVSVSSVCQQFGSCGGYLIRIFFQFLLLLNCFKVLFLIRDGFCGEFVSSEYAHKGGWKGVLGMGSRLEGPTKTGTIRHHIWKWPSQSSDWNLIKNTWRDKKMRAMARRPSNFPKFLNFFI